MIHSCLIDILCGQSVKIWTYCGRSSGTLYIHLDHLLYVSYTLREVGPITFNLENFVNYMLLRCLCHIRIGIDSRTVRKRCGSLACRKLVAYRNRSLRQEQRRIGHELRRSSSLKYLAIGSNAPLILHIGRRYHRHN